MNAFEEKVDEIFGGEKMSTQAIPTPTGTPAPAASAAAAANPLLGEAATVLKAVAPLGVATPYPYEGAIIAVANLASTVAASVPPADAKAVWDDQVKILEGILTFGGKIDFLHLFGGG